MDFDNLKSSWKKAGVDKKDQKELLMMTKIKNHPTIKRIRIKLIIETILIIAFLAIYYDGFDGATKPIWANILLIVSAIAYIIVRIFGWIILQKPIRGQNLKSSLVSFQSKLKQIANLILFTSFLFGVTIIAFFTSSIDLTRGKYFVIAGMVLSLILLVYLSSRNWFKRVEGIKSTISDFDKHADL